MTPERRKIIDRVHKLRRLGVSPGPEGDSARAIADKLIAEHGLKPAEVEERVEPIVIHAPGRGWAHRDATFVSVAASVCLHAHARARVEGERVTCPPDDPMALLALNVVNDLKYAVGPWSTSRETLDGFALGFVGEMARLDPSPGVREAIRRGGRVPPATSGPAARAAQTPTRPVKKPASGGLPAHPTPPRGRNPGPPKSPVPGTARTKGSSTGTARPGVARVSTARATDASPAYLRGIEMGRAMAARILDRLRRQRL